MSIKRNTAVYVTDDEARPFEGLPAYTGANPILSSGVYNCGTLFSDIGHEAEPAANMRIVSNTNKTEWESYTEALEREGFERVSINVKGNTYNACHKKDGKRVYTSYFDADECTHIILETRGCSAEEFSYTYTPKEGEGTQWYFYGLNMDPGGYNHVREPDRQFNTSGFPNCGMLVVAKTADSKIVIIDGGYVLQMTPENVEELDEFLHKIAGKGRDEVVDISCWFCTHLHPDHYQGFYLLLNAKHELYNLERVLCNVSGARSFASVEMLTELSALIAEYYPDCKEHKVHTGERLMLADNIIDVLFTHEDKVDGVSGKSLITRDFNDTSTVLKFTSPAMRVMILGDMNKPAEAAMIKNFTAENLNSDIVQEAHHNFNCLEKLYGVINAPIVWFSQTEGGISKNEKVAHNASMALKHAKEVYFSGSRELTAGFEAKEGVITKIDMEW